MRFATFPLLFLSCSALAAPIKATSTEAEFNVVERAIHRITDAHKALAISVLDLNPDIEGAYPRQKIMVEERVNDVISGLNQGTKEINDLPRRLYPSAGYNIWSHVEELEKVTETTMNTWIVRKPTIFKAGGQEPIYRLLIRSQDATTVFYRAMIAKLPLVGSQIGQSYADSVAAMMVKIIKEYEPSSQPLV